MHTKAIIAKDSPRTARWREVFGSEAIPLVSPLAQRGEVLGMEAARFYKLDGGADRARGAAAWWFTSRAASA